jgi:Catechol dioxygenase N terminus
VKHLYAFAREVDLTTNELIKLAEILTEAGKISDASRHEFLLMSDVMGLTMVVDCNTNRKPDGAFESSVLGPFYRADAPWIDIGGDICRQKDVCTPALVSGRVLSIDSSIDTTPQCSAIGHSLACFGRLLRTNFGAAGSEKIPRFAPSIRILQSAIRFLSGTTRVPHQVQESARKTVSQSTRYPPLPGSRAF